MSYIVNNIFFRIPLIKPSYFFFFCKIVEYAERRCSAEGKWEDKNGSTLLPTGWTNYTPCYTPEMLHLMNQLYAGGGEKVANVSVIQNFGYYRF